MSAGDFSSLLSPEVDLHLYLPFVITLIVIPSFVSKMSTLKTSVSWVFITVQLNKVKKDECRATPMPRPSAFSICNLVLWYYMNIVITFSDWGFCVCIVKDLGCTQIIHSSVSFSKSRSVCSDFHS